MTLVALIYSYRNFGFSQTCRTSHGKIRNNDHYRIKVQHRSHHHCVVAIETSHDKKPAHETWNQKNTRRSVSRW